MITSVYRLSSGRIVHSFRKPSLQDSGFWPQTTTDRTGAAFSTHPAALVSLSTCRSLTAAELDGYFKNVWGRV